MDFPTTRWSLLAQATGPGDPAGHAALAEFYRRYREPVLGFIRRQNGHAVNAEDLAQEFFLHLIAEATLQRAERTRGRFRSFLLGALVRFLHRERTRTAAAKRGGGVAALPFEALADGAPTVPPEIARMFDRQWARELLARARETVRAGWAKAGRAEEWAVLAAFLPGAAATPSYEAAAAATGSTPARLKSDVFRLRREFREQVRQEIALTVEAPHEIDAEMRHLHAVLVEAGDDGRV